MFSGTLPTRGIDIQYGHDVEEEIGRLEKLVGGNSLGNLYPPRWLAVKLLEEDQEIVKKVKEAAVG